MIANLSYVAAMKPIFKIPARFAPILGVDRSAISRWNHGKRGIPDEIAIKIVELLKAEGIQIHILDLKPRLRELRRYLRVPYRPWQTTKTTKKIPGSR